MTFEDQYKHPKWQKKRLEKINSVMKYQGEEALFCEWCGASEDQLQVHHIRYYKDRKVWEYSNDELLLLCGDCHKKAHAMNDELKDILSYFTMSEETFTSLIHMLKCMRYLGFHHILHIPEIFETLLKIDGKYKELKEIQDGKTIY